MNFPNQQIYEPETTTEFEGSLGRETIESHNEFRHDLLNQPGNKIFIPKIYEINLEDLDEISDDDNTEHSDYLVEEQENVELVDET